MTDVSINLDDILSEMDELGRAKFDAALERAKNRKLQERIDELTAQRAEDRTPVPAPRVVRNAKELAEHAGPVGG